LKKYNKLLHYFFLKYGNTGFHVYYSRATLHSFEDLKNKTASLSIPEIWKMIQDFGFDKYINHIEHKTLVRLVNVEGLNDKTENKALDYNGFKLYMV